MLAFRLRRPRATAVTVGIIGTIGLAVALAGCGALGALAPALLDGGKVNTIGTVDFVKPLAIPALAASTLDAEGRRMFELSAQAGSTEFLPGQQTDTWGFDGSYLGPTLVANRGEDVGVVVRNELDEATTVHWHGMHLPPAMDGGPHQMVAPGAAWTPKWTIDQPAATLWYHPHPHGATEAHVRKGLAGLVIIKDEAEEALGLPSGYGMDDIPLIVQDARFDAQGQFSDATKGFVGSLGDTILVNGTIGPYLEVTTELVRLRLLNASTARIYNFSFGDEREYSLIATDGGLLTSPHPTRSIQLSPGERAEIVVAFKPGETATLRSTVPELGIGEVSAARNGGADNFDVLEMRAAETLADAATLPSTLASIERLIESEVDTQRDFTLDGFVVNQEPMRMDRIDEVVTVDTTEIWNVRNGMAMPHNFHVHDVQFQVLSVDGAEPTPELAGWKDTIYLRPQTQYRLIMRFTDYTDTRVPYMYHCHLLWHEDQGMMGQFLVVKPGEEAGIPLPVSGGHSH